MTAGLVDWNGLTVELDQWAAIGLVAPFWWRDDDAAAVTPALDRLLALRGETDIPLALAVIPARAEPALAERLLHNPGIVALQHGYTHENHAGLNAKKSEFPADRPLARRLADLEAGRERLKDLFGPQLLPVLVPPWNRAAADLLPHLAALGFRAISGFKPYAERQAAPGLAWLNTQVDPIDWHGGNPAAGAARALDAACEALRAMRLGTLPMQPLGFLTHHLRHDEAVWHFTTRFLAATRHPAARWIDAASALAEGETAAVTRTS